MNGTVVFSKLVILKAKAQKKEHKSYKNSNLIDFLTLISNSKSKQFLGKIKIPNSKYDVINLTHGIKPTKVLFIMIYGIIFFGSVIFIKFW